MKKTVLIVGAHPDDEVLGCGGAMAKLSKERNCVFTLILGEGLTSRDKARNRKKRAADISKLKQSVFAANGILGVEKVFAYDFPDNRFDSVPLLDIVKVVEGVKSIVRPDIVFTHYEKDLNIDHAITYRAVLTATRPVKGETVKEIYSFEVPSSTEWRYPQSFDPDIFIDIGETLKTKIRAMRIYDTEIRDFPHPRSCAGIETNARYRGMHVCSGPAEAFKCVRVIR